MKKISLFIIFISLFVLSWVNASFACSCLPPDTPQKSLENANSVFVAKALSITNWELSNSVKFELIESYKWTSTSSIDVVTSKDSASCWYNFIKDNLYIVYTSKDENWKEAVSLCSRTALLENASKDLEDLSKLKKSYSSKLVFELAEWETCQQATDWCNTFFMNDWKVGWGTKMACLNQTKEEWSCINKIEEQIFCTMQYDPVCWVDGKTYGNACTAWKTKIAYYWECKNLEAKYLDIIDKIMGIYKQRLAKFDLAKRPAIHQNVLNKIDAIIINFKNDQTIVDRLTVLIWKLRMLDVSKL